MIGTVWFEGFRVIMGNQFSAVFTYLYSAAFGYDGYDGNNVFVSENEDDFGRSGSNQSDEKDEKDSKDEIDADGSDGEYEDADFWIDIESNGIDGMSNREVKLLLGSFFMQIAKDRYVIIIIYFNL